MSTSVSVSVSMSVCSHATWLTPHPGASGTGAGSALARELMGVRGFGASTPSPGAEPGRRWLRSWVQDWDQCLQPCPALGAGLHPGGGTTGSGGSAVPKSILQGARRVGQDRARGWGWPDPPPQGAPAAWG